MAQKTKSRSEAQNFKNKTNPQGNVDDSSIKEHLEKRIVEEVKNMAKGIQTSVYQVVQFGKELIEIENQMERAASNKPTKEDF